jgi:hypothetical protein
MLRLVRERAVEQAFGRALQRRIESERDVPAWLWLAFDAASQHFAGAILLPPLRAGLAAQRGIACQLNSHHPAPFATESTVMRRLVPI